MRSIAQIIEAAGGPRAISEASAGAVTKDAVYKWATIGIQDRHWGLLMGLTEVTVDELFRANLAVRSQANPLSPETTVTSFSNDAGDAPVEACPASPPPEAGQAVLSKLVPPSSPIPQDADGVSPAGAAASDRAAAPAFSGVAR